MVQSHIKSLLYAYDCVIIPDFGGLITHYAPAKIHPVKHTFSPPSKRVAFNEQLKVNDGLLISTLAHRQQWPMPQAQQAVASFVQELKEQLLAQHKFELKDVGVFRYNTERKLVFESIDSENFLEKAFGLPELVSKPIPGKESLILRGNYQDQTASSQLGKKSSRFRRLYRMGATLIMGGMAVAGIYLLSLQSDVALSSLNPFALITASSNSSSDTQSSVQDTDLDALDQAQVSEQYKLVQPQDVTVEEALAADDSLLASFSENTAKEAIASPSKDLDAALPLPDADVSVAAAPAAAVKAEDAKTETVKAVVPVEKASASSTIKQKTGRFYIIMGVFSLKGYAANNQKRLLKKGFDAKIVAPAYDTKRQRVSVADFATEAEAYAALPGMRSKVNNELWVFNY